MKAAMVADGSPTAHQRWRVPFCTTTSPGDSSNSAPSSTSTTVLPERRTPKSVVSVLCVPGSSPSSTCISGVASGATTSNSGEYVAMEAYATYEWEYTGRRRIVPRARVGCGLIGTPEEGEFSYAGDGNRVDLLVAHENSATPGVVAGITRRTCIACLLLVRLVHCHLPPGRIIDVFEQVNGGQAALLLTASKNQPPPAELAFPRRKTVPCARWGP